jgi:hypothetical protein
MFVTYEEGSTDPAGATGADVTADGLAVVGAAGVTGAAAAAGFGGG